MVFFYKKICYQGKEVIWNTHWGINGIIFILLDRIIILLSSV